MKKISKIVSGFTLMEFLVVTVVVSSIGIVIVAILSASLRSTNKTSAVNVIRLNGNRAITQIVKTIGYAKTFEGVNDGVEKDYIANCVPPAVGPLDPTPTLVPYKKVKVRDANGRSVTFSCEEDKITVGGISLIDEEEVKFVEGKCWFTCFQDRITSSPIIGISFQLKRVTESVVAESNASMSFETSVTFKNPKN